MTAITDPKLAKLASLQALDTQDQTNAISQQDAMMRALSQLYGISQQQQMAPEKLKELQLQNEAAGYKNDWFQPQAAQQYDLGNVALEKAPYDIQKQQGEIANLPLQAAALAANATHATAEANEMDARVAAGEPAARTALYNQEARFKALPSVMAYYDRAMGVPGLQTPPFIQSLTDSMMPPADPRTLDLQYATLYGEAMAKHTEKDKLLKALQDKAAGKSPSNYSWPHTPVVPDPNSPVPPVVQLAKKPWAPAM